MQAIEDEPISSGSKAFSPKSHDIEFKNVTFSYQENVPVLNNVSFVAREGQVTALVGGSGGGKSTAAQLAARFWEANSGTVMVGGVDVTTVDPETLLRDFAIIFQEVMLFDETVMENIRLGRKGQPTIKFVLQRRRRDATNSSHVCRKGMILLSVKMEVSCRGGERQRISIARALLKDAPIVLLDEATASLDVENETQIQQAPSQLLVGKTALIIAHRMRTVMNADQIVVLKEGRIVEQGSPADLKERSNGLFFQMVEKQLESARWIVE